MLPLRLSLIHISFVFVWVGLICGIVGLILASKAKKQNPNGMATAGFVLSLIGLILSVILVIVALACAGMIIGGMAAAGMLS